MNKKTAIIIGAGPTGLTAAYELLKKTDIKPVIFEQTDSIGGISRTINYNGNRMDLGGHRFFSKSDDVMKWWLDVFPLQGAPSKDDLLLGRQTDFSKEKNAPDPEKEDKVMLLRGRLSRIFYLRKFFNYPVSLSLNTVMNLGFWRIIKIGFSYLWVRLFPIKEEKSLEDFMVNRFGRELFLTFFNDYTYKVWGVYPKDQKPDWGAQRIKGLSISKLVFHAMRNIFKKSDGISQKNTETSLIERFIYPKYGPGQLWEEVADRIIKMGGEIHLNKNVTSIKQEADTVKEIYVKDKKDNKTATVTGDYFFSTMPVKDLIFAMGNAVPIKVRTVAQGLIYRNYITVGLLVKKLGITNKTKIKTLNGIIPDLWIYVQEKDVKIGRIQIYNNWSPYLVKDLNKVWLALEYFCNDNDEMWLMPETEFKKYAVTELEKIGIVSREDVVDSVVVKVAKVYPAYFGAYDDFHIIQSFTDKFKNLFLIGRNGMHKYNNMDHSMLSAMAAVDNIKKGIETKDNIWEINAEKEYHEEKK